ncbi:MAG: hypothetical protein RLZZ298_2128, partial [Pseudomonadota bacterium]
MPNTCFDPVAENHVPNLPAEILADPFRRRLLSAAVLSASG